MALIVRIAYPGSSFTGFQRGNGSHSVEDSILLTLKDHSLSSWMKSAARTDRGVSASGNVIMIEDQNDPNKSLRMLNAFTKDVFFSAYAKVANDFRPRHCISKTYAYLVQKPKVWYEETVKKFQGKHDFASFCRRDQRSAIRSIDSITCETEGKNIITRFRAKSFVWEQIRSIVGFSNSDLASNFEDPFTSPPDRRIVARPEPLILERIDYENVNFTNVAFRAKEKEAMEAIEKLQIQGFIQENILRSMRSGKKKLQAEL